MMRSDSETNLLTNNIEAETILEIPISIDLVQPLPKNFQDPDFPEDSFGRLGLEILYFISLVLRRFILTPFCFLTGAVVWIFVMIGAVISGCCGCKYISEEKIKEVAIYWFVIVPGWR